MCNFFDLSFCYALFERNTYFLRLSGLGDRLFWNILKDTYANNLELWFGSRSFSSVFHWRLRTTFSLIWFRFWCLRLLDLFLRNNLWLGLFFLLNRWDSWLLLVFCRCFSLLFFCRLGFSWDCFHFSNWFCSGRRLTTLKSLLLFYFWFNNLWINFWSCVSLWLFLLISWRSTHWCFWCFSLRCWLRGYRFVFFSLWSFLFNFFGSFLFMSNSRWSSLLYFCSNNFLRGFCSSFSWTYFLNCRLILFFGFSWRNRFHWSFWNLFYFFLRFRFFGGVLLRTRVLLLRSHFSLYFLWGNLSLWLGRSWFSLCFCWCWLSLSFDNRFLFLFWFCDRLRFCSRLLNRLWFDFRNLFNYLFSWNNFLWRLW